MIFAKNEIKYESIALYIHIPFCKKKCLYCDFPSYSNMERFMLDYSKALSHELEKCVYRKVKTIFIGGGTPTYLSLDSLKIIGGGIKKLKKVQDLEFTVEGNPGTFSEEKLALLGEMGANRLSIGLQAWQDSLLKAIGRIHTVSDFIKAYNEARYAGFKNINVDLMFGLPGQKISEWKETLDNVVSLGPEHISCYSLIIEEGTPMYEAFQKGCLNLPSEEEEREMYSYAVNFLKYHGYCQYEISNFSKKGMECRHNITYWNLDDYIGCGAGAHSYIDGTRSRNTCSIEDYINMINSGNYKKMDIHINTKKDEMEEFMFMGLRKTDGISLKEFNERFAIDIFSVYGKVINKYLDNGLLHLEKDRLYLSFRGIEISNSIMCDFILN